MYLCDYVLLYECVSSVYFTQSGLINLTELKVGKWEEEVWEKARKSLTIQNMKNKLPFASCSANGAETRARESKENVWREGSNPTNPLKFLEVIDQEIGNFLYFRNVVRRIFFSSVIVKGIVG